MAVEVNTPLELSQWETSIEMPVGFEDGVRDIYGVYADKKGAIKSFLEEYIFKEKSFFSMIENFLMIKNFNFIGLNKSDYNNFLTFRKENVDNQYFPNPIPKIQSRSGPFYEQFYEQFSSYISTKLMWGAIGGMEFDLTGVDGSMQLNNEVKGTGICVFQTIDKLNFATGRNDAFKIPALFNEQVAEVKSLIEKVQNNAFRVAFYNVVINDYIKNNKITPEESFGMLFKFFLEKKSLQRINCFEYLPTEILGGDKPSRNFLFESFVKNYNGLTFCPFLPSVDTYDLVSSSIRSNDSGWLDEYDTTRTSLAEVPIHVAIDPNDIDNPVGGDNSYSFYMYTQRDQKFTEIKNQTSILYLKAPDFNTYGVWMMTVGLLESNIPNGIPNNFARGNYRDVSWDDRKDQIVAVKKTDGFIFVIFGTMATEIEYNKYVDYVNAKYDLSTGNVREKKRLYFSKKYFSDLSHELPTISWGKGNNSLFSTTVFEKNKYNPDWGSQMVSFYSAVLKTACDEFKKSGYKFDNPFALDSIKLPKKNLTLIKNNIKNVYPDTFLNLKIPLTPFIRVELRTSFPVTSSPNPTNEEIEKAEKECWEGINFNPNSHFISMEFEDNKGVKRISLNLFDKYYTTLENIIAKAIVTMNLKTSVVKEQVSQNSLITYAIDKCVTSNMRIKFGYQTKNIYNTEGEGNYLERVDSADLPTYQVPWQYFQILNFNQQPTDQGMNFNITGINSTSSIFDQIKLVKQFAIIKGLPENIIDSFRITLNKAYGGTDLSPGRDQPIEFLPFIQDDDYKKIINDLTNGGSTVSMRPWHLKYVEIPLGDKKKLDKNKQEIKEYKTFKEILDMLCSKIPPLSLNENNEVMSFEEGQEDAVGLRTLYYTYSILTEGNKLKVKFYYANPDDTFKEDKVTKVRTYFWRSYGATVVKNINISTETNFAQLNMPIFSTDASGNNPVLLKMSLTDVNLTQGTGVKSNQTFIEEEKEDVYLTYKENFDGSAIIGNTNVNTTHLGIDTLYTNTANKMINNMFDETNLSFCGRALAVPSSDITSIEGLAKAYSYQFSKNMNSSIFKGTVELLGDPFYLFDENFEPYKYLIRLVIMRPDEKKVVYDEEDYENNPKSYSYLSGYYVVTNIKHNIGNDGYSTILEVMKWPSVFEIPLKPDVPVLDQTTS